MPYQEPPATETPQWEDPFPPADLEIPQPSIFDVLEPDNQATKLPPIRISLGSSESTHVGFSPYGPGVNDFNQSLFPNDPGFDSGLISTSLFPDHLDPANEGNYPVDDYYSDFDWYQDVGYFDQPTDFSGDFSSYDQTVADTTTPDDSFSNDDSSIYDYQANSDQGPLETSVGGWTADLEDIGGGQYLNPITGLIFDNGGNVVGGDYATDPVAGFDDLGGGWFENPITGNITDSEGNVIYALNENGTYMNIGSGQDVDLFGVQAQGVSGFLDSFFGPLDKQDTSMVNGPSSMPAVVQPAQKGGGGFSPSMGGGGSGSGSTKTTQQQQPATQANPSAAKKTIVSDQRIGNDRYLVYSDGSSQRVANYYKPAAGATAQPTTVSSLLDNLFKVTGSVIGAVSGTPANVNPGTLNQAVTKPTTASAITGQYLNTQASNVAGAKPIGTPAKAAVSGNSPASLGMLALLALGVKVFILH